MTDFQGLVAVTTGGASGIGAATARLLQARGARLTVLGLDVVLDVNVTGIARVTRAASTVSRVPRLDSSA